MKRMKKCKGREEKREEGVCNELLERGGWKEC